MNVEVCRSKSGGCKEQSVIKEGGVMLESRGERKEIVSGCGWEEKSSVLTWNKLKILLEAMKRKLVAFLVHMLNNLLECIWRWLANDGHGDEGVAIETRGLPVLTEPLGSHCDCGVEVKW